MTAAKPVEGTSDYFISKCGKLFSLKHGKLRQIRTCLNPDGYEKVKLSVKGTIRYSTIHRLVGQAWVRRRIGSTQINHKNGIKTDNRAENLEWVTLQQNNAHAVSVLGRRRGSLNGSAKIDEKTVRWIREQRRRGRTYESIGMKAGIGISQVKRIVDGDSWAHI